MTLKNIHQEILENIKDKKPLSKKYFYLQQILIFLGILTWFLLGSYFLALFFADWQLARNIYIFYQDLPRFLFLQIFVELTTGLILVSFGIFHLYRKTDWAGVKHRLGIVLVSILILLSFTTIFYNLVEKSQPRFWQKSQEILQQTQIHRQGWQKNPQEKNVLTGKIIQKRENKIVLISLGKAHLLVDENNLAKDFKINDFVQIKFLEVDGEKQILEIETHQKRIRK